MDDEIQKVHEAAFRQIRLHLLTACIEFEKEERPTDSEAYYSVRQALHAAGGDAYVNWEKVM